MEEMTDQGGRHKPKLLDVPTNPDTMEEMTDQGGTHKRKLLDVPTNPDTMEEMTEQGSLHKPKLLDVPINPDTMEEMTEQGGLHKPKLLDVPTNPDTMEEMTEQGGLHKRKFLDVPTNPDTVEEMTEQGGTHKPKLLDVPTNPDPFTLIEFPRYESLPLPSDKSPNTPSDALSLELGSNLPAENTEAKPSDKSPNTPSDALSLELDSNPPAENTEAKDFQCEGWDEPIIVQLEELLSSSIHSILSNAINAISASGYSEEDAFEAIWKSSLGCFWKDLEVNIVDDALTFLSETEKINSLKDYPFEDLQQMVKYTMCGMICKLMECRPSLNVVKAMWSLLMCDLSISRACAMEEDFLDETRCEEVSGESSSSSKNLPLVKSDSQSSDAAVSNPNEENIRQPSTSITNFKSEAPISEAYIQKDPILPERQTTEKESLVSASDSSDKSLSSARGHVQTTFQTSASEQKSGGGKKGHSKKSNRESKLRLKASCAEKRYLATRSSGAAKNGKLAGCSVTVPDKRQKFPPDSLNLNTNSASASPAANMKPSSLPAEKKMLPTPEASILESPKRPNFFAGIPYDHSLGKYCPQNEKDVIRLNLIVQYLRLHKELLCWTEWANNKVMQVAHRLSMNQAELKTLRQDKEEVEQFQKEKQNMEESAMKRLYEMECALGNASDQCQKADSTTVQLEKENIVLKKEWELLVIQAGRSAEQCDAAVAREKEALKKVQSLEGQKGLLQEELANEKVKMARLQHKAEKAKDLQNQTEAKWKQERNAKEKVLMQAASLREDRQRLETLVQAEEHDIKQKQEIEMQKCLEDIKKLEDEISELRIKSESSKIAALRRGMEGSSSSRMMDEKSALALMGNQPQNVHKRLPVFKELEAEGLRQDRECVMCLSEERSVVFLPCAHQVLCEECNVIHEEKGVKDCPSCRTPIERRINVRYVRPKF